MPLINRTFDIQNIFKTPIISKQLSKGVIGGILLFAEFEWIGDTRDTEDQYIDHTIFVTVTEGSSLGGTSIIGGDDLSIMAVPAQGSFVWEHPLATEIASLATFLEKLDAPIGTAGDLVPGLFKTSAYIHALLESQQTTPTDKHDLRVQTSVFEFA